MSRITNLQSQLKKHAVDGLLVSNQTNILYLTGYGSDSNEKDFWMLLTPNQSFLFTDPRYSTSITENGFKLIEIRGFLSLLTALKELVHTCGVNTLGFEESSLAVSEFRLITSQLTDIHLLPVRMIIEKMRLIKHPVELENITTAAHIADQAFNHILSYIKIGMTEAQIALQLEVFMRENGASSIAFAPVVAFGKNAAVPHHKSNMTKIEPGGVLLLDFGARFNGYCSDITRTVFVGTPKDEWVHTYELVLEAQENALVQCKPGTKASHVDELTRSVFRNNNKEEYFLHSTGHGVGLEIHEGFTISPANHTLLMPGMVFTIEPGLYFKEWGGIRIENLVTMSDSGVENLSQATKAVVIL